MRFSKKAKLFILIPLLICIVTASALLGFGNYLHSRDTLKGIVVNGKDLSGYSYTKAQAMIDGYGDNILNQTIVFTLGDNKWKFNANKVGVSTNASRIFEEIVRQSKSRSIAFNLQEYFGLRIKKDSYELTAQVDKNKLLDLLKVNGFIKKLEIVPVDAKIYARNGEVIVTPEKPGKELDIDLIQKQLMKMLNDNNAKQIQISLMTKKVFPDTGATELKGLGINGLLASYTTSYSKWQIGRSENIRLAAEKINNYLLRPGELFSFNKVVGPRTMQLGFRYAPEIVNGKLKPGIGGGVCQVSSTLYNAILRAELDPVRRINHTKPSHYVPLGLDATVSYGSLDFVFNNNLPNAVLISTSAVNGKLTVDVYGKKGLDNRFVNVYTTDITNKPYSVVVQKDPSLVKGTRVVKQKGAIGYTVKVWRDVRVNAKLLKREQLSRDVYKPTKMVIVENI